MTIFFFTAGIMGIIFIAFVLEKQSKRTDTMLKENKNVQPIFQLRAAHGKIRNIEARLKQIAPEQQQEIHQKLDDIRTSLRQKTKSVKSCSTELDQIIQQINAD